MRTYYNIYIKNYLSLIDDLMNKNKNFTVKHCLTNTKLKIVHLNDNNTVKKIKFAK